MSRFTFYFDKQAIPVLQCRLWLTRLQNNDVQIRHWVKHACILESSVKKRAVAPAEIQILQLNIMRENYITMDGLAGRATHRVFFLTDMLVVDVTILFFFQNIQLAFCSTTFDTNSEVDLKRYSVRSITSLKRRISTSLRARVITKRRGCYSSWYRKTDMSIKHFLQH